MIMWNTDVNAPCCPGEIVDSETGQTMLIQTDWDYPGVAGSFGWSVQCVQRCPACGSLDCEYNTDLGVVYCQNTDCRVIESKACPHDGTDGTVDCADCGITAGEFIMAAGEWLENNDGTTAEDPGYFSV
jgi:hypothetical protein